MKGHFDGQHVILDEPVALQPNTQVTVIAVEGSVPSGSSSRDVEAEFGSLSQNWRKEVGAESALPRITGNLNYLRIIALGEGVVPFILRDLEREAAPWFLALRAITGEQNVGREYAGNFRKMADSWIAWGRQKGYI